MRTILTIAFAGMLGLGALTAAADSAKTTTVADLYKDRMALAGKSVSVTGKLVKANNGIRGKNFLHIQDGTGEKGSNDLTVTSQETAAVGSNVTVTGLVTVDRDLGGGYTYILLMEDAKVSVAK